MRIPRGRREEAALPPRLEARLLELAKHAGPLEEFLVALTQEVAGALGVPVCEVLRSVPEGFVPSARLGFADGSEEAPLGDDSYAGYAARAGETLAAANYLLENRFKTGSLRERGIKSGVITPIRDGDGAVWGVLAAHDEQSHTFGGGELLYVEEAARLASAFVRRDLSERARLRPLEEAARDERSARKNAQFRLGYCTKVCRLVAVSATLPAALTRVAAQAVPTVADWCFVDLVPTDGKDTVVRVAIEHADDRPAADEWAAAMRRSYPLDHAAAHGTPSLIATGDPAVLDTVEDGILRAAASMRDDTLLRTIRQLGVTSYMGVPIEAEHGRVGVLGFYQTTSRRRFTPDDREFAEALAPIVGARLADADRTAADLAAPSAGKISRSLPQPSREEQRVLDRLAAGRTPREISDDLMKSYETVRVQVKSLNRKFRSNSYPETVGKAVKWGLVEPQEPA